MTVTRRHFVPATAASLAAIAAAPAFGQQTSENVKWRLTSSFPKSLDTLWGASTTIARVTGEMTDGKFVLTGSSAAPPRLSDQVRGVVTGNALIFNDRDDSVVVSGGASKAVTQTRVAK